MPSIKLTKDNIKKLKPGEVYFDTEKRGLCVRVTENGVKTFSVVKRVKGERKLRRFTLGKYHPQEFPLASARDMAEEVIHKFNIGQDPTAEKKQKREDEKRAKYAATFGDLVASFLKDQRTHMREASHENWSGLLNHKRLAKLRSRRTPAITTAEIIRLLDEIRDTSLNRRDKEGNPKPGKGLAANRSMEAIRRVFTWAMEKRHIDTNPFVGIKKPVKQTTRTRFPTDDELGRIVLALGADNTSDAIRLCLYTGCRLGLALGTQWRELDLKNGIWNVPIRRGNKVDREWQVPLVPAALRMLEARANDSDFVFATKRRVGEGSTASWRAQRTIYDIRKKSGVEDWTPHDLRRKIATWLSSRAGGSTPYEVRRAILGHVTTGIEATYDLHQFELEKKEALERWAAHVARVVAVARANAEQPGKLLHMPGVSA